MWGERQRASATASFERPSASSASTSRSRSESPASSSFGGASWTNHRPSPWATPRTASRMSAGPFPFVR